MNWEYHIEDVWQAKKFEYIETKFKELGADGWELVLSVERNPMGESASTYFIFKRPKSK